jgi:hypothetical protein
MLYYVNGRKITLTDRDFVFKGGEGSIYEKGNIAYKIYTNQSDMIPEAKIKELQCLEDPRIINPQDVIFDKNKRIVGFTMQWLGGDTIALCKLFTNTFRENNGIENDHVIKLVENIKNGTTAVHDKKCLIVDLNEFNLMVAKDFITPFFIDVNSYQTPSFPATAIMPSIRDWRSKDFSMLTDWFSFAIISFQLFIGIHPFKGRHKKYAKNDFEKRIIDCVSVLNSKVRCPPPTRDFNLIPSAYRDWYYDLFEKGNRKEPPLLPGEVGIVQVKVVLIKSSDNFEVELIKEFAEDLLYYNVVHGTEIVKTKENILLGKQEFKVNPDVEFLLTVPDLEPILIKIEDKRAKFYSLTGKKIHNLDIECTDKMIIDNTLYLRNGGKLIELAISKTGDLIIPSINKVWPIEQKSSQLFSGVVYQNVLGKAYFGIPIPKRKSFMITAIPELDEYHVVDAKHDNMICVVTAAKGGVYSRFIIVFAPDYKTYKIRILDDIDYSPINFVTLDNGVCIMINDDDTIEMFLNRIDKDSVKKIQDPQINSSMRLCKDGVRVLFFRENKLYSIKMK